MSALQPLSAELHSWSNSRRNHTLRFAGYGQTMDETQITSAGRCDNCALSYTGPMGTLSSFFPRGKKKVQTKHKKLSTALSHAFKQLEFKLEHLWQWL